MQAQDISLQSSVSMLDSTVGFLKEVNQTLDTATKDFERLQVILETNRVFGVVTASEIQQAKSEVATDIHPQILSLLDRAENELSRLERKERSLTSKAELQQVRLSQFNGDNQLAGGGSSSSPSNRPTPEQLDTLQQMQQKRDRLAYSLKRLNLQKQKARMSLAWTHQ